MDSTDTLLPSRSSRRVPALAELRMPERSAASQTLRSRLSDETVRQALTEKILGSVFPCVAAKSAVNRGNARIGVYGQLGDPRNANALCEDLYRFNRQFPRGHDGFFTYMAAFPGGVLSPADEDSPHARRARSTGDEGCDQAHREAAFERALWTQLQSMHELDRDLYDWDDHVASDPNDPEFSFSVGGRAFFIIGMHPGASRQARWAPWPVLVFNAHEQFEQLKEQGRYDALKKAIRTRDIALQGDINPVLADFGDRSEARQYSGRAVGQEWRCPFHRPDAAPTGEPRQ